MLSKFISVPQSSKGTRIQEIFRRSCGKHRVIHCCYKSMILFPCHQATIQRLLMINMRDGSIILEVNIQPAEVSARSYSQREAYLSGLKSLVTIDPGSMILVSFGRSAFAKVYEISSG